MSNWFIVEDQYDWDFLQTVINFRNAQIDDDRRDLIYTEPDVYAMQGLDHKKLRLAFTDLYDTILVGRKGIKHVGVVVDNDGKADERIEQINTAIESVFGHSIGFKASGDSGEIQLQNASGDIKSVKISCFLMGVDNRGELETVLKAIASAPSPNADCLDKWYQCVNANEPVGKKVDQKQFEKRWVWHYTMFDTDKIKPLKIDKKEDGSGNENKDSSLRRAIRRKPIIWDFEHDCLSDLHSFLDTFSQT